MEKDRNKKIVREPGVTCERIELRVQRGIVLLITLLVLVAMMLASVGIMRSVDTSTMAVSNMALRQAAEASANQAAEFAVRLLATGSLAGKKTNSDATGAEFAYFASYNPANDDARGIPSGRFTVAPPVRDTASGNVTRTVIERMCSATGAPGPAVVCPAGEEGSSSGAKDTPNATNAPPLESLSSSGSATIYSVLYRISVRVDGPNGTLTFAQAIVDRL